VSVCGVAVEMLHDPADSTVYILLLYISSESNSRLLYSNTPFRSWNSRKGFLPRMYFYSKWSLKWKVNSVSCCKVL